MKKMIITGIIIVGILVGGASIISATVSDKNEPIVKDQAVQSEQFEQAKNTAPAKEMLSIDKVKEIALSEFDGRIDDIELERDNGYVYYEVEIQNGADEYNLDIDAYSGEVLFREYDRDDDDYAKANYTLDKLISAEEAKAIAVKEVGGKVIELELDEDDGRYKYEIELVTNEYEFDVEVDALTGDILKAKIDD